ncbi:MAG TPA: MDR family MFS transporter [Tepidiformaceae bacterium]|nr:MDR family MFS transporter [Tepidiformaceae bacterium]
MFRVRQLPYKWLVAIVFISGLFMDMVDSTVVNVAIPQLSRDFHASISSVEWTVTGYLLSLALFIPAAGYLSDRFGTKRCFLIAMGIFVAASGLCGQAHSLNELIAFRFLQGAGGGMMTPVGTAMLSREFPGAERAKASALMSVPIVFAPMVGPIFGGYLVTNVSWRWIFYLNLPIGIASFLFAFRVLKEHKEDYARHGFDLIGLITGSGAAALILYALSEAATVGWTADRVVACGLGGVAMLGVFVLQELRSKTPIIDLGLFRRPLFTQGNLIMMPAFAMFTGFFFIFTLYLQELQGWSAFQAGLITAPASLVAAIAFPFASMYYARIGPKRMLLIGCTLSLVTLLPFGFLTAGTVVAVLILVLCIRAFPFSFASVAAQTLIYGPLESSKQGPASSAYNTMRQVAASLGVALIATVQANQFKGELGSLMSKAGVTTPTAHMTRLASQHGYQMAFFACAGLMVIPLVVTMFVDNKKAEDSLKVQLETRQAQAVAASTAGAEGAVAGGE